MDWVPHHIRHLAAYEPGKPVEELERELGITGALKLASNENPLGPSPRAVEAGRMAVASAHRYPDGSGHQLRGVLAARLGVPSARVVLGAGSNELVHLLVRTFAGPGDQVLSHDYAFVSYKLAAAAQNVEFVSTSVTKELRCDVEALISRMGPKTRVVFLANPNNPTGAHWSPEEMARVMAAMPDTALLVVDEAYYEYASASGKDYQSVLPLSASHPRLVVLRTLSKAYGLAGMRVGYGVMSEEVAGYVHRVRRPFHVNAVAQSAAVAALADDEHVARSVSVASAGIARLSEAVQSVGCTALPAS